MIKLSIVLFAASALIGITAAPVYAAATHGYPTHGCQFNCDPGEPGNPGEPFDPNGDPVPEGCMFNCGDTSTIPDPKDPELPDPGKPGTTTQFALDGCGEKLGGLRDVTVSQIRGVESDDVVDIIPVCRSKSLAAEQDSVAELRPEINENATLNGELRGDGYNANDVVGVIVNGKAVTLYVHRI